MIDHVEILIRAGNGGSGAISFRREKFAPLGGPDGGDGGDGGNVILRAVDNTHMLRNFQYKRSFTAGDGGAGSANRKTGKGGDNLVVDVPIGTVASIVDRNGRTDIVADLIDLGQEYTVARGGRGGKGNTRYAGPQNRAPLIAEAGDVTTAVVIQLELQLIADVAVIGLPNVGKSSLLGALTGAHPQVADYPFTTLEPVLGVIEQTAKDMVIVEIPGLIENAHRGVGLGDEFLKHAQRTAMTLHLLDGLSQNILRDYNQTKQEMALYDRNLSEKPEVVAITKVDISEARENLNVNVAALAHEGISAVGISTVSGEGTQELIAQLEKRLTTLGDKSQTQGEQVSPKIPIVIAQPRKDMPMIERDGNILIVKSSNAERLVNRVDLEDTRVQAQLMRELDRMGVVKALEKAGVEAGVRVKIGNHELLWQ